MFSNSIIDSDKFLDMPLSTQALYFHLGMKADDDGFVGNPKKTVRSINCTEDDLRLLIAKGFVYCFDSGVIVITHWNIHNSVRKDRKKDTLFLDEKRLLTLDETKVYYKTPDFDNQLTTTCQPSDNQTTAQGKLSKDKLSEDTTSSTDVDNKELFDFRSVVDCFNSVCISLPKIKKLSDKRKRAIRKADKLLDDISFEQFFLMVEQSDFLTGRKGDWSCGFDWIMKPDNLTKIIEGNYRNDADREKNAGGISQFLTAAP